MRDIGVLTDGDQGSRVRAEHVTVDHENAGLAAGGGLRLGRSTTHFPSSINIIINSNLIYLFSSKGVLGFWGFGVLGKKQKQKQTNKNKEKLLNERGSRKLEGEPR